ncbi:glutathione hydrolase 1 proenzyme-like isoform X1 [Branchiostoma floridae x Branchiostoma japonicum]
MSKKLTVLAVVAAAVAVVGLSVGLGIGLTWQARREYRVGDPCEPDGPPVGSGGPYSRAAVATDAGRCSNIGSDILEKGGSAVDSAIASLLCIGLINAHSSGIGGGLFMTIYDKETNTAEVINARDMAPAAATENMYQRNFTLSTLGGLAVAVPGEIRAFWEAHQRHGKLPWKDLFQPAIQLAEEGVCIAGSLAGAIEEKTVDIKRPWSGLCDVFCDENNNVLGENQIMKRPKLAETLRAVADGGADAFYTGDIARNLAKDIQDAGGIITEQDFRDYVAEVTSPLNITLAGGLTVLSPPPPSSGAVLSLILNILDGYQFSPSSVDGTDNQILTYHRIVEAFKFAYAKRTELGDPNFVDIAELIRNMTSGDYAESLRQKITDDTTHDYRYYGPSFVLPEDSGTSHVSVLAPNGDAVSVTSTINLYFGSKLRSRSTGVILNNLMDDFSSPNLTNSFGVPPSPANFIRPGKRMMSSMNPAVVVDGNGDVRLVTGASGGTKITTATAYVLMQHLWFGLDIGPAVETPRLHHQLLPDRVDTERSRSFQPEAVLEGLRQKNHVIHTAGSAIVNGVSKRGDVINAACDTLKGGFPVGF